MIVHDIIDYHIGSANAGRSDPASYHVVIELFYFSVPRGSGRAAALKPGILGFFMYFFWATHGRKELGGGVLCEETHDSELHAGPVAAYHKDRGIYRKPTKREEGEVGGD